MTAVIRITDLRANRRYFIELVAGDMSWIYGKRLETLLRGQPVVMGSLMHKIAGVNG